MFAVKNCLENGFNKVLLIDEITETRIEIVPGCGAMLHAFIIKTTNEYLNIIDSYNHKKEFDDAAESAGFKGLKLSPFPCRIPDATYKFEGKAYRLRKFINNGAALHGLLYNQAFKIVATHADEEAATISLAYEYRAEDPGYPFMYDCTVNYILTKENKLTVTTVVHNVGESAIPIADGWHPYFTFRKNVDALELQFQSEEMLEFINLIPSGKILPFHTFIHPSRIGDTPLDNSFVLDFSKPQPCCVLRDLQTNWQLEILPDASYPYLQIYIPPHRQSIAIENLSAPPDAFNNGIGLITLQSGASATFSTAYAMRKIEN